MNKRILMSFWAFLACAIAYCATPATGYYRVVNVNSGGVLTEDYMTGNVICTDKGSATDYEQMWQLQKVSGTYRFRNIYTGRYIQLQSGNSQMFRTGTGSAAFSITERSSNVYLIQGGNYMHCDASSNVVGWWDTNNAGNHWTVEKVTLTTEQIEQAREDFNRLMAETQDTEAQARALNTFFADAGCTTLKDAYQSMSDADLTAAMTEAGLSANLQKVTLKIKNNAWEAADNHQYAKEFRVHSYRPFSDAASWQSRLGHHAYSYMSNPTGIYGNAKDLIYVFVGSDIPAGATLTLKGVVDNELITDRNSGTALHKGLNIVSTSRSGTIYYVVYTVDTAEGGKKIADYPNLDIHIEGGFVNGYYDDTQNDSAKYQYLLSKASNNIFIVMGRRSMFSFSKAAFTTNWPKEVHEAINWFDKASDWEQDLLGFSTAVAEGKKSGWPDCLEGGRSIYPDYCNNYLFAFQGPDDSNPNASYWRSSYPGIGGIESSFNAYRENFDNWCVGHEVGHQHQDRINLEGCSESSNNLFSGIVTFQTGYRMSRGGSFSDNKDYYDNGTHWYRRDIGMTHRMYYQLWLYYHLAGKKKDFFPTFFELLRQDPIRLTNGHNTESALKMIRKACQAANEDLTDFFEFWGFLKPIDNLYIGDYTPYTVTYTQEDIDALKAEMAKYPRKNTEILFIEDRIKPIERWDIHAQEGEMRPRHEGGTFRAGEYGDVGNFTDYIDGQVVPGNYTYNLVGTTIILTGEGGVGFIIKDQDGHTVTYSNKLSFEIPSELAAAGFSIEVINGDGTKSEVKSISDVGDDSERLAALRDALAQAAVFTALSDETGKRVGCYPSEKLVKLEEIIVRANSIVENADAANYSTLTKELSAEMLNLINSGAMTMVRPGAAYSIQNCQPNKRLYISSNSQGVINTATSGVLSTSQWAFVPGSQAGRYAIQNRSTKKYIDTVPRSAKISAKALSKSDGVEFVLRELGDGRFGVEAVNGDGLHLDASSNIVGWWDYSNEGNQWVITEASELEEVSHETISQLKNEVDGYIASMGTIQHENSSIALQTTSTSGAGYISTNYQQAGSGPIANLVDGNRNTDFYTNSDENKKTAKAYHHLLVNLGAGKGVNSFSFSYTTARNRANGKPTEIVVSGGTSATQLTEIMTFRSTDAVNPLPAAESGQQTFESGILICPKAYRYIRFSVRGTNAVEPDPFPFFGLAELSMKNRALTVSLDEAHAALEASVVNNCVLQAAVVGTMLENSGNYSVIDFNQAYETLKSAYEKLQEAVTTGIEGITTDAANGSNGAVYDLSGRRVAEPVKGGVYVVGGQKVLMK